MSFQANRRQSQPDDGGYALPIVIVVIAVGAMVAIALLGYAVALLRAGEDDADSLLHLYAADAGITLVKERLEQGLDPAELPPFPVGDIEVTVDGIPVSPPRAPTPTPNPRVHPLNEESEVIINSLPEGLVWGVGWRYMTTTAQVSPTNGLQNPTYTSPSIKVYPQLQADETPTPIATSVPCFDDPDCSDDPEVDSPERYIWVRYEVPSTGDIRIIFDSGSEVVSKQEISYRLLSEGDLFRPLTSNESARSLPELLTDYVVESETDRATVTAYIRRIIRWCPSPTFVGVVTYERCDDVTILSWKPYPRDPPDSGDELEEQSDDLDG